MKKPSTLRALSLMACACIAASALTLSSPAFAQHAGGGHAVGGGPYGGYHGGGYGFYGPWGWGGLGLGLYFASLPLYYSTVWWGGVPYYYADDTYYRWNGTVNQYETVTPPAELLQQSGGQSPAAADLIAYPKDGQSEQQQGKDRYECHRWAADKTGFDPTQVVSAPPPGKRSDYNRAQAACLEGRGYSVK
jgi:hypothetical protein